MPAIIRLDGKAFHTLMRSCTKPFDTHFNMCMKVTAKELCSKIQGVKVAYVQSDEISLLLTDFDRLETDAWFDGNIQKIASVSAGMASAHFTVAYAKLAVFDSRVFNIPKEEVCNYFIWRQNDWTRNSVSMMAQSHYSHKELHKKGQADMHEMLHEKGVNWAKLEDKWKNGTFVKKNLNTNEWIYLDDIIVKEERLFVDQFLDPVDS
jgi:tRNA(His) 5'-end guanylyltransferase